MPADSVLSVDNASMYTQPEDIYDIHAALVSRSCLTTEEMSSVHVSLSIRLEIRQN
jgi:hypothetical protein